MQTREIHPIESKRIKLELNSIHPHVPGERKPRQARKSVVANMHTICAPLPRVIESSI